MTTIWAQELIEIGSSFLPDNDDDQASNRDPLFFDVVYGRSCKLHFGDRTSIDVADYDRDNGGDGAAERVIERLRITGEVHVIPTTSASVWADQVIRRSLMRYDEQDLMGVFSMFVIGMAQHPDTAVVAEDIALHRRLLAALQAGASREEIGAIMREMPVIR